MRKVKKSVKIFIVEVETDVSSYIWYHLPALFYHKVGLSITPKEYAI